MSEQTTSGGGRSETVPIRRQEFASTDSEEISDHLGRVYTGNRLRLSEENGRARMSIGLAAGATLTADHFSSTMGFRTDADPMDCPVFVYLRGGGYRVWTRRTHHADREPMELASGADGLQPPRVDLAAEAHDLDLDVLRIPDHHFVEAAAAAHGEAAAQRLRFLDWHPLDAGRARYWRTLAGGVYLEMMALDSALTHPILANQAASCLATAALLVFPNTTLTEQQGRDPSPMTSAALAKAVDYIHAHRGEALGVTEIADVAGVTARALQYAFRAHYDLTPLGYHRRVRLEAAHDELVAADPARGQSVAAIAARWGFRHPGRFAIRYQRLYGRSPSDTLRN
ncbi:helix-turn-helix transcriptional regulator [Nocardia takedensis]|uniref:helix-turn-helix transcriptional regulator n=1 Tax=Nocardia takedensis TaxID=259390 RepID=UPI00031CD231|nr:helix-turn-helix transcriptional regulator [Nocardia takedensis]